MLPLKVSWTGQTFALARCSDSLEKKPRRRRTKEERRTMVEFFIKKHRNSNNGKFPSLNLTHKEVGGSFYTVREIVREIIQENKVLGPGSLTSKALNLDNCLEEDPVGSFSMGPHATDQEHKESYSLSSEHQMISKESYGVVKSETPETFASHPNGCLVSQVTLEKSSDHLYDNFFSATSLDVNLMDAENEEANSRKASEEKHDNSGVDEVVYAEIQDHSPKDCDTPKVEQPVPLLTSVSITYPSSETGVNEYDIGNRSNSMVGATNSFADSNDISEVTGHDILPETKNLSNSGNSNMSSPFQGYSASAAREALPLASTAAKTCCSDRRSSEAEDLTSSLEVLGMHNLSNDVEVAFLPVDNDPIIKRIESTENLSPSLINETPATSLTFPMPQNSGTSKIEPQHVLQHSDADNIVMNTESALCESLPLNVEGTPSVTVKAEYEVIASNGDRGIISNSISSEKTNEELEKEEINPVWAAVKAFVAAVIKIWTE